MNISQQSVTGSDFDLFENFKIKAPNSNSNKIDLNNLKIDKSLDNSSLDKNDIKNLSKTNSSSSLNNLNFVDSNENIIEIYPSNLNTLNNIPSGATIKLNKGIYPTDININNKNNITIIADQGTVIKGSIQINSSDKIKLEGFKIEGSRNKDSFNEKGQNLGSNIPELIINDSKDIQLSSINFNHNAVRPNDNNVRGMLEISPTSENVLVEGCKFSSSTENIKLSKENKNLLVDGIRSSGTNILIRNNEFSRVHTGIVATGNNSKIEANKISWFSQDGINIAGNNSHVTDNFIRDLLGVSGENDHHDGIQAWSNESNAPRNARFSGKYSLDNVDISRNTIVSTTDPNRDNQGALQGIVAFDGLMKGLKIDDNNIKTHSTIHGITINGPLSSKERTFTINSNNIEFINSSRRVGNASESLPAINLNRARYFDMDNEGNLLKNSQGNVIPKNIDNLDYNVDIFNNGDTEIKSEYVKIN
jgi:hypothetical protein